jgi:hypothetical protein
MTEWNDMIELSRLLEAEFHGKPFDRMRARDLAYTLLPQHPEIRHTLRHVHERLSNGRA